MKLFLLSIACFAAALVLVLSRSSPSSAVPLPSPDVTASAPERAVALDDVDELERAQVELRVAPPSASTAKGELAPDGRPWSTTYDLMNDGAVVKTLSVVWDGNVKRMFHPNGQLYSEATYVDGRKEGRVRAWHENGQLHLEDPYVSGKRTGMSTYFSEGGVMIARGAYKENFRDGLWQEWFHNGVLQTNGSYVSDGRSQRRTGPWTYWRSDGSVDETKSGFYEKDEKVRH